jgi:membrane peptidoglycan carboxypeptidase
MLVKEVLVSQLGESMVNHGGLTVTTTLDSKLQNEIQKTVSSEIDKIKNLNVKNGSSLVTNPKTGEVLAMVGSKNYFDYDNNGQVNLTTSLRQPGSSIKPLNYALAFENNKKPTDTVEDKPITILYNNNQSWSPRNYDNKFHGTVTLKQALANSYNIPSVLLLKENGIQNFANFAKKMGINNWNDPKRYGLSMSLGSLEVKMTELSTAYSAFANEGVLTPLNIIKQVKQGNNTISIPINCLTESSDTDSKLYDQDPCQQRKVISAKTAKDISDILSDNVARSGAFGANSVLNIKGHKVAVKTGTSNDLKDNWTIGYNKDYLVATWVGNNDSKPMSKIASGVTGASPIWSSIFTKLLNQKLASR